MRQGLVIAIGLMTLLASGVAQASVCAQKKPWNSDILIEMETPDPHFDLTKNINYLNSDGGRSAEEWLKKNNMQGVWSSKHMKTHGLASGGWGAYYEYVLDPEPVDQYWAYACLYVKELKIRMMYRTIIYIPTEYPKNSCAFNIILEHELRHYEVNKTVAQKTTERLRQDMPQILMELENEHVGSQDLQNHGEIIKARIKDVVDVYFMQVMGEEMEKRNSVVDSPEEYGSFGTRLREECGVRPALSTPAPVRKEVREKKPREKFVPRVNIYEQKPE